MNDSLRIGKKSFAIAVAAVTILWSIGFSAFIAPLTAHAAVAGDLIKGTTLTTVYYYASNGQRYIFPNEKTYFTWYSGFTGVQTLSDSALADIPLGGNVVYRPGARWIKVQSLPQTYAVTPNGTIRWVETESVATGIYGSNWNTFIDDVPDTFWTHYTEGPSLMSAAAYNGLLVNDNGTHYVVQNNTKRLVTSAGWTANRFQDRFLVNMPSLLTGLTAGSDVTGYEAGLSDPAQLGVGVTGGLSVSLSTDTPAGATLPDGATGVEMFRFNTTANSGSATITSMTFDLVGVNVPADIADNGVYLYEGTTRLTDGKSVVASNRQVTFAGLSLALTQGQTKSYNLRVNVTGGCACAGDTIGFALSSATSVQSSATVSGSFPVRGNLFSVGTAAAGEVTITTNGTITDPFLGTNGALIGQFQLAVEGEDGRLNQVTFEVDDAADHTNYKLMQGSSLLASGEYIGRKLVKFVLPNTYLIADGNSRIFKIMADVGGEAGDSITVHLDNDLDLAVVGSDFGFNLTVDRDIDGTYDGTSCDGAGGDDECSFSEIRGGKLTFAFNGPQTGDIKIGGDDISILDFSVTAQQATTLKDLQIDIAADNLLADDPVDDPGPDVEGENDDGEANFESFRIVNKATGATLMGPEEIATGASDAAQSLDFSDDVLLSAGQTLDLALFVDVSSTGDAADDEEITATLDMSEVEADDTNGDALAAADIVPSTDLAGNVFTLTDASLDVTVTTPPGDSEWVKGANGVDFVAWAFAAGESSEITVTDVTLTAHGDDDDDGFDDGVEDDDAFPSDHISSCSLYDGLTLTLVDGSESFSAGEAGEATFSGFSWTVPAGETKKLLARCNLANVAPGNGDDDEFYVEIDAVGDVTAVDDTGDAVGVTAGTFAGNDEDIIQTVTDAGTIEISLDGGNPTAGIVLGSSTGVSVMKLKGTATAEPFRVKKVTLENDGDDAAAANVKVSYKKQDGTTGTKTGFLSAGEVVFDNLDWYVSNTSTSSLTVSVDTNVVSGTGGGAASGDTIDLDFLSTADADFEAIGLSSNSTLDGAGANGDVGGDLAANVMTLRKTKPTLSLASGSPSGAGIPGLAEVYRFNVAADTRGDVTIHDFTFKLTSTDTGAALWNDCDDASFPVAAAWALYDSANTSTELGEDGDWDFADGNDDGDDCDPGVDLVWAKLTLDAGADNSVEVGAGETKTYILKVDTTGASTANDHSVRFDIETEANLNANLVAGADSVEWGDGEAVDIDGTDLKNLPVIGGTIIY
ncbi:MAG: hypothetical protein ACD_66C00007G0001 [uncultured bacterium]|nr:MAG: hypothetical protein ACD_66C00007G0001 [uncultured bacterium]HBD05075.1 hypothetical protein [Candidatus Uhrbacteria bacterium]